jgi:hypothetical protein
MVGAVRSLIRSSSLSSRSTPNSNQMVGERLRLHAALVAGAVKDAARLTYQFTPLLYKRPQ